MNLVRLFADIAVAGQSGCFRLARGIARGNYEEAVCIEQGLQFGGDALIQGSGQYKDDFTFPLHKKMEYILFQLTAEATYDAVTFAST